MPTGRPEIQKRLGLAMGPVIRAAAAAPKGDRLAADRLLLLWTRLLEDGQFELAQQALDAFLKHGQAHPYYQLANIQALTSWFSVEWASHRQAATMMPIEPPGDLDKAIRALAGWPAWSLTGELQIARGRMLALRGRHPDQTEILKAIREGAYSEAWKRYAAYEQTGSPPLTPDDRTRSILEARLNTEAGELDGRLDEKAWDKAPRAMLKLPGGDRPPMGYDGALQVLRSPTHLLLGLRLDRAAVDRWDIAIAIDADRDAWTQVELDITSTGQRSARLALRHGPAAQLSDKVFQLQGQKLRDHYSFEIAIPLAALGLPPRDAAAVNLQVTATARVEPLVTVQFQPAPAGSLQPEHAGLLVLPAAPAAGDAEGRQPGR